jgi:HK97 family phage prohead protease
MTIETLSFDGELEIKADSDEVGRFSGMAATFGNMDQHRDIIEKGAFADSLKTRPARKVKFLAFHNPDEPIGVFDTVEENEKGLFVEGRFALGIQRADEVHTLAKMGAIDSMSIGFRAPRDDQEFDADRNIRRLKKIDLLEVSFVTFPANEKARIRSVKDEFDAGRVPSIRDCEKALRDVGFSISNAKRLLADGYKGLTDVDPDEVALELFADELRATLRKHGIET